MPILEALERLCHTEKGKTLLDLLRGQAPMWLMQMPSCLEQDERAALQQQLIGASRERMLREFAMLIEAATHSEGAAASPLLVVVLEDLQWSDSATLALLSMLARRQEAARVLVLGTYRPVEVATRQHPLQDVVSELSAHKLGTILQLATLSATAVGQYLEQRLVHATLPLRLAAILQRRSGGNPLFLINIVDDLVEREILTQHEGNWLIQVSLADLEERIPDNLRYLIAKQIDRLSPAEQALLEAASVTGAEFSMASVAAALRTDVAPLEQQAERLAERLLFLQRVGIETWPDGVTAARYEFQHALYQQIWHERTTIAQQQQWHQRIGQRKEIAYGGRAVEIAAELAVHFEQARDYQRAVRYHGQAAENAARRHAYQDAIDHLEAALALLKLFPDTSVRDQQEINQQLTLGMLLTATKGYTAPEVEHAYARARDLSQRVGETPQLFSALHGLCRFFAVRAAHDTARALGEQLVQLAHQQQDPLFLVEAHYALGTILFYLGQHEAARTHMETAISHYTQRQHLMHVNLFGQDPSVACRAQLAWILWILGYPDQAMQKSLEALTLAQELAHPFTLAFALYFVAVLHQFRRESSTAQQRAEELLAFAHKHAFSYWLTMASVIRGKEEARQGTAPEGLVQVRQGLAALQKTGTAIAQTYWLTLLVETNDSSEQQEEGTAAITQALERATLHNERNWEPELYRLKGQLMLQKETRDWRLKTGPFSGTPSLKPHVSTEVDREVEEYFRKAIDLAHQQKARMLKLRAAVSLAHLWKRQGRNAEARQLLSGLYNWFTEGFDTVDLREAHALLSDL
jgi:predicted ATPase